MVGLLDLAVVGSHGGAPCGEAHRGARGGADAPGGSKPRIVSIRRALAKTLTGAALALLLAGPAGAQEVPEPEPPASEPPAAEPQAETPSPSETPPETPADDASKRADASKRGARRQRTDGPRAGQDARSKKAQAATGKRPPADDAKRAAAERAGRTARPTGDDTAPGTGDTGDAPVTEAPEASADDTTADEPAAAAPPKTPAAPTRLIGQDNPDATQAAVKFATLLRQVVQQELHVQDFERATPVATADPETLHGFKAKRNARIEQDRTFKKKLGRRFSLYASAVPSPAPGVRLSAPDLALLERLKRAHDMSRRPSRLTQWQEANADFLKKGDWARRDRAVQLREAIIEQESDFTTMLNDARAIANGDGTKAMRNGVVRKLDEISPESRDDSSDYVQLTLTNPDVRTQVLTEVLTVLGTLAEEEAPPRPEEELVPEVDLSRASLIARSGLVDTVTAYIEAEREMDELSRELLTNDDLDPADRHTLTLQRDELEREMARLKITWRATEADAEAGLATIELQNELIRRRMLDIGYRAAAFVRRRDTVEALETRARAGRANVWAVIDEQQELLALLDEARPAVSPLEGLDAPPTAAEMAAIQSLRAKVQEAISEAMAEAALPGAGGGGGGGGGKGKKGAKKKPKKKKGKAGGLFDDR